jgi:CheY-like chemotaxis protein
MGDRSQSGGLKVLVVDDHLISREFTAEALRDAGALVKQADSASAALQSALSHPPDLILMDIQLAGESGPEAIGRIRASWPAGLNFPRVIVLSAEPVSRGRLGAAGTAVEAVLQKPVSPRRLREILNSTREAEVPTETPPADPRLRDLFRRELRLRLSELDQRLAEGQPAHAAPILHQLIASTGFCGEPALESRMRAMLAECRHGGTAAGLARSFYSVWTAAAGYLDSGGRVRTI